MEFHGLRRGFEQRSCGLVQPFPWVQPFPGAKTRGMSPDSLPTNCASPRPALLLSCHVLTTAPRRPRRRCYKRSSAGVFLSWCPELADCTRQHQPDSKSPRPADRQHQVAVALIDPPVVVVAAAMSPSLLERIGLGRDMILQAFGSGSAASAAQAERGARAVPPCRESWDEDGGGNGTAMSPAASSSSTGAGGSGSPGHAVAVAAGASPGLSAETALSILVDCFGH